MFTNTKEVELYDLTYEYSSTLKFKNLIIITTTHQFIFFSTSGWTHYIWRILDKHEKIYWWQRLIVYDII
jgi:hypothetical protein